MEFQGVTGSPYRHPVTRRKIPAPFTRPTINSTGGKPVKRYWKDTKVTDLKRGDTVANFGLVESVVEFINDRPDDPAFQWRIRLYNVVGDYRDFPGSQRVYAFTADTNE